MCHDLKELFTEIEAIQKTEALPTLLLCAIVIIMRFATSMIKGNHKGFLMNKELNQSREITKPAL